MGFCMPGTGGFAFKALEKTFAQTSVAFVAFLAPWKKNLQHSRYFSCASTTDYMIMQ